MLDLNTIQGKIDDLWESETSDSITNWIFNNRLSAINTIIGDGEFVSIKTKNVIATFTSPPKSQNFTKNEDSDFEPVPPYRQAA